jgi:hypothetical protein
MNSAYHCYSQGIGRTAVPTIPFDRLSRLMLAAVIVYVWLISLGSRVIKRALRCLVDHRDRQGKSLFRIRWDWVERCLTWDNWIPLTFRPVFRRMIGAPVRCFDL